jgi:hypothetical protein
MPSTVRLCVASAVEGAARTAQRTAQRRQAPAARGREGIAITLEQRALWMKRMKEKEISTQRRRDAETQREKMGPALSSLCVSALKFRLFERRQR